MKANKITTFEIPEEKTSQIMEENFFKLNPFLKKWINDGIVKAEIDYSNGFFITIS